MKDPKINRLSQNQQKTLRAGLILVLIVFLILYFFILQKKTQNTIVANNTITLEGTKLQVFNDTYVFNGFPDKILIHYPYFLFVQSSKPLTIVYNLETKKKEQEIKEVLLDYYQGNMIYNKRTSFLNSIDLDKYCDSAFIKSSKEVLCITRTAPDSINNMLISIPVSKPNFWDEVYKSDNLLTAVSVINNDVYIGEIAFKTNQSYVTVNKKSNPVDNIVNMIYPLQGKPYFASFKSNLNNQRENYYIIEGNKVFQQSNNQMIFYQK